jgi:hypothetical protein
VRQFGSYLPLVLKGELRGANPSTRGLGWANLWCTGCYANSSAGQLSWDGRTAAPREILLYTSSRTRFLNRTSIGERCKHREVFSDLVLNEIGLSNLPPACNCGQSRYLCRLFVPKDWLGLEDALPTLAAVRRPRRGCSCTKGFRGEERSSNQRSAA